MARERWWTTHREVEMRFFKFSNDTLASLKFFCRAWVTTDDEISMFGEKWQ